MSPLSSIWPFLVGVSMNDNKKNKLGQVYGQDLSTCV